MKALEKAGFRVVREGKHIVMSDGVRILTIPRANPINAHTQPPGNPRGGQTVPDSTISTSGGTIRPANRGAVKDYHINIFFSEEDDGYIADIPDLDSCSAFGSTPEEALAEVEKARKAWIEAARSADIPIPPPRYRPAIYQTGPQVIRESGGPKSDR